MDRCDNNDYYLDFDDAPSSSYFHHHRHPHHEDEITMMDMMEEDDLEFDEEELAELLIQDKTTTSSSSTSTISLTTTTNNNALSATTTTKRKFVLSAEARERRNRRRRLNVIPRILKSDIRRDYATMLTNVLNSFDKDLMIRFMTRYCTHDCQLLDYVPEGVAFGVTPVIELEGFDAITKFWVNNVRYVPDFICQTDNTQLRICLSDGKSKIVSNTRFRGTKCFQPANTEYEKRLKKFVLKGYHQSNLIVDEHGLRLTGTPEEEYVNMLNCDVDWLTHRLYHLPTTIPPVDLNLEGTFTLYVDSQNRIYKFEFLSAQVKRQQQSQQQQQEYVPQGFVPVAAASAAPQQSFYW